MQKNIMREADDYLARQRRHRIWKKIVGVLACAVVFCTTYMLILPAITMEKAGRVPGNVAYIGKLAMGVTDQDESGGIVDGSTPFDKANPDGSESDGCDSGSKNKRVRTFDTITYNFYYSTSLQNPNDTDTYDSARIYFEFLLPVNKSQAYFSVDDIAWLKGDNVSYVYEKDEVVIGKDSYQVLHGSFLDVRENGTITAAIQSRDVTVRVLNMENGSKIQPVFSMWMEHNTVAVEYDENDIPIGVAYQEGHIDAKPKENEVASLLPDEVTVTCTPRYAITLKRGLLSNTSWARDFDFSTGNELALDKPKLDSGNGIWNGRISAYGIRLMVKGLSEEHGLRGCAFPEQGDTLEFDITLTTAWQSTDDKEWHFVTQEFTPRVWSAEEFMGNEVQKDERKVNSEKLPSFAAPLNKGNDPSDSCKDGGTWTFADAGYLSDNQNHRRIHVTVSGYTFDPKHLPYACESGTENGAEFFYNPEEIKSQFWKIQDAVFSTGEIWVVTPFYDEAGTESQHYITNVTGVPNLTMWQSIFVQNIKVNNGADIKYQEDGELGHLDASITLKNPGIFDAHVSMIKPLGGWDVPLTDGCFHSENELKDYATPGSYADLEVQVNHDAAEGDYVGVAYNVMAKFDNAFFEPVTWSEMEAAGYAPGGFFNYKQFDYVSHTWIDWPEYKELPDYKEWNNARGPKMLYGTTKNGAGWSHKDASGKELKPDEVDYDEEMMKATPDDLIWYDTMEELKAAGAECVAVLMEYRNVANDGTNSSDQNARNHLHMVVHGRIKETAETGYVYAVTNYAAAWTKGDVKKYVTDLNGDGLIGAMDYLLYTHSAFPSYSPSASNKMNSSEFPEPSCERSWDRCVGVGEYQDNNINGYRTAWKSYLDENGVFKPGNNGYYFQDNVYVVGYKSEVGIQVAQEANGASRINYNMDSNQRVADFMVTPKLVRSATDTGAGGETATQYTDVTLTVTLPLGMEYYPATATWGGSYVQDDACREPGTVTDGQPLETIVEENADGTTLTWVLKKVPLSKQNEVLEPVYFSARIGNTDDLSKDVVNNQNLKVQTDIYSDADRGVIHGTAYHNQANTSIQISKAAALTIIKTADQNVVDYGDAQGFTMKAYNSSESEYTGWIVDILPQNGIGHSSYNGSLRVEEFKIVSEINRDDVKFYYTTEPSVSNTADATNLDVGDWTEFSLDENRSWRPDAELQQPQPITAIAYQYTIPGKRMIEMHITLSLPGGRPGDVIHNKLLLNNLLSSDRSKIVSRTLEGLAWMDENYNGIQDEAVGSFLSGVKVELLKLIEGGWPDSEKDYVPMNVVQAVNEKSVERIHTIECSAEYDHNDPYTGKRDENGFIKVTTSGSDKTNYIFLSDFDYTGYDYIEFDVYTEADDAQVAGVWFGNVYLRPGEWMHVKLDLKGDGVCLYPGDLQSGFDESKWIKPIENGDPWKGKVALRFFPQNETDTNKEFKEKKVFWISSVKAGIDDVEDASVSVETGKQISVRADDSREATVYEPGRYKFTNVPDGTYAVRFTDGRTTKISPLIATVSNQGADDTVDSDSTATYTPDKSLLLKTMILGIEMPKAEDMSVVLYESKYHDSGFYERGTELPKTGGTGTLLYTFSGIAIMGGALLYYIMRRRRGENIHKES